MNPYIRGENVINENAWTLSIQLEVSEYQNLLYLLIHSCCKFNAKCFACLVDWCEIDWKESHLHLDNEMSLALFSTGIIPYIGYEDGIVTRFVRDQSSVNLYCYIISWPVSTSVQSNISTFQCRWIAWPLFFSWFLAVINIQMTWWRKKHWSWPPITP